VTPLVVTPVVKPPVVTPPVIQANTPAPCRIVSSSVKVRSLSSLTSSLKRTSTVRLKIKATCSLRLTLAAALGKHGSVLGRASVLLKKGTTKTVLVHLTRAGRGLIANKAHFKVFVTGRTPAVKGLSPARTWSTTIAFHS
jgi:hypothetical protein